MIPTRPPHTEVNEDGRMRQHPGYGMMICWYCGRENIHVVDRARRECVGVHLELENKNES